jgi:hypothetical protein
MLLHKCWLKGPGFPGLDDIEEVACMDEHVGFLLDDLIYRFEKIIVSRRFIPLSGSRRLNAAAGGGDGDEVHFR